MSCFDHRGNISNVYRTGEALDNGLGNDDDPLQLYLDHQEAETAQFETSPEYALLKHLQPPHQGGTSQFGTPPNHAVSNPGSMHVQPPQLAQQPGGTSQFATIPNHAEVNPGSMNFQPSQGAQQPGGTSQFGTTPNHAEVNPGSMNFQPAQWAQQQGGTSQFVKTPNHAEVNSGSMNVQPHQWAQQPGGTLQFGTPPNHPLSNPGSMHVQPPQLAQQPAGALQFGTPPSHALSNPGSMHVQPPQLAQQPRINLDRSFYLKNERAHHIAGALQFGTPPSHAPLNPESMDVHPPPLAQQPGTSQSSNVSNADAEKRSRIRESKRKCWEKKEEKRRENEEKVAEFDKQNHDLREINARLVKEVVEAKVKQQNVEQELGYCKEEVASPEATDVAEENKQLKRKIELLTTATNNPDIIKTVELQEENEKLKRELKKLRILNDALCGFVQPVQHSVSMDRGEDDKKMFWLFLSIRLFFLHFLLSYG
uniref:Uncharacterized protein n=1 Tax=Salix viminalis TaxID=40686 RepID=A0A6N2MLD9_SALVM